MARKGGEAFLFTLLRGTLDLLRTLFMDFAPSRAASPGSDQLRGLAIGSLG